MSSALTPPSDAQPEGVQVASSGRVVALCWDAPLSDSERALVSRELARALPQGCPWIEHRMPTWVGQARLDGERAFERSLLVWLSFAGITRTDTLVVIEPADDLPLLFSTVNALHAATGRVPYTVTCWQTVRGSLGRQRMAPRLRRLGASGGALSGMGDPMTQGMIAWMLQAAEQADLPDEAVVRHENLLRVVVPAVSALLGRCLPHDLLDVLEPPEHLLALEAALPMRHVERRSLSEWLRPGGEAAARGGVPARLRAFLERDLHALAHLLRSSGQDLF